MVNYEYKNFIPYGAGEMYILDSWVSEDDNFSGNVTKELIKQGFEFEISDNGKNAKLILMPNHLEIEYIKKGGD